MTIEFSDLIVGALEAVSKLDNGVHVNKVIVSVEVKKDLLVFNYSDESWAQAKFDFRKLKIVNF